MTRHSDPLPPTLAPFTHPLTHSSSHPPFPPPPSRIHSPAHSLARSFTPAPLRHTVTITLVREPIDHLLSAFLYHRSFERPELYPEYHPDAIYKAGKYPASWPNDLLAAAGLTASGMLYGSFWGFSPGHLLLVGPIPDPDRELQRMGSAVPRLTTPLFLGTDPCHLTVVIVG